jgi:hypothetical protein
MSSLLIFLFASTAGLAGWGYAATGAPHMLGVTIYLSLMTVAAIHELT